MSKKLASLILLVIVGASPALCQDIPLDKAKEADIRKLIEMSGAAKVGDQVFGQMMGQLRAVFEPIFGPTDRLNLMLNDMMKRFQKSFTGERMADAVVPIYARYFSHEDVKQLIAFYETPLGKRVLEATPKIMLDSMNAGSKLGQDLMAQVLREMANDYPELKTILEKDATEKPATVRKP